MSNKSRRRLTMAAGALLAGAAIPIAAAGTAWADDPAQADQTETTSQLEHQGLTKAEAQAVVTAENNGTPVQVSYDGTTVVNDNQGSGPSTDATASSDTGPKDVAAAIGVGSEAGAGAGTNNVGGQVGFVPVPEGAGEHDTSFANGAGAEAFTGNGNDDKAIAQGDSSEASSGAGSHDIATANTGGLAVAGGSVFAPSGALDTASSDDKSTANGLGDVAVAGTTSSYASGHDTATVAGGNDSTAEAMNGTKDSAKVDGSDSTALAGFGYDKDKAFADGSDLSAVADSKNDQHVTVHPSGAEATPLTDLHVGLLPLP
jgi:hypothetical protein